MKTLYLDCFSGISGDMTLGAFIDMDVDFQTLKNELEKLNLSGYQLIAEKKVKGGISGTDINVVLHDDNQHNEMHDQNIAHEHHEHHHSHTHTHESIKRSLHDIRDIIISSALSDTVKEHSLHMFERLAEVEATIHQVDMENVHFHEVGAVDAIVDIVGAAICFDLINPDRVVASSVHVGSGFVKCAHGMFPVPAPATLELLKGVPIYSKGIPGELVTPTGAVILTEYTQEYMDFPSMVVKKIGYGLGKKDFDIPNCLRVCLGETIKK